MSKVSMTFDAASLVTTLTSLSSVVNDNTETNMRRACIELETEIKRNAPVDTGNLRASYSHVVRSSGGNVVGHVGSDVIYAAHQEYGTRHQSGTPHVRPALEAKRTDIVQTVLGDSLRDAL